MPRIPQTPFPLLAVPEAEMYTYPLTPQVAPHEFFTMKAKVPLMVAYPVAVIAWLTADPHPLLMTPLL